MWCLPHQPFSLWDLGSGVQMGIFAFKSKETERKLSKKLGHRPPPSPPQTPPGTKALAWHPLHPPGPTQKLKQLETWPDPRSVLVPAPATGVLPAGHDAHGKASWTVALGGKVSWGGGQDSHRRDRQNGMELCVVLVSLAGPSRGPGQHLQSQGQVEVRRALPQLFSMSPLFCPASVLVPLIRSTKEMTK